jgi:hypothetical protein
MIGKRDKIRKIRHHATRVAKYMAMVRYLLLVFLLWLQCRVTTWSQQKMDEVQLLLWIKRA